MLWLIGTGLCDAQDLSLRARAAIERADHVYLEGYTSLLRCSHAELEEDLGRPVAVLAREDVESGIGRLLDEAKTGDVALLVVGDPFGATTHADLLLRARDAGVEVRVAHNASVLTAVGATGLELYRFGHTVSLPYWEPGFEPTSFLPRIAENCARGLHTLCLLDIKADRDRFMTIREGLELLERAQAREPGAKLISPDLLVVGVARLGWPDQLIRAGTLSEMKTVDFGRVPHAIIIPGTLHDVERDLLIGHRS